jgi:hypothetical protein
MTSHAVALPAAAHTTRHRQCQLLPKETPVPTAAAAAAACATSMCCVTGGHHPTAPDSHLAQCLANCKQQLPAAIAATAATAAIAASRHHNQIQHQGCLLIWQQCCAKACEWWC